MKTVESILREEVCELERIVEQAKKRLQTAPKGFLRIKKKRGKAEFYYKNPDVSAGKSKYLKKSEQGIAKGIAQRDYDVQMLKNAMERIKAINLFLDKYEKTNLKTIYRNTNECRRELITAPILPDDEFVKRWQATQYTGKAFAENTPEIITEGGERVRSKSEKIIADKLYSLGIPYRYEYPLVFVGNIKVYPDFTILKMPEREEVYLEHLGMLDDEKYMDMVMYKLSTYEKNGIYLGVNLFITYETSKTPLNTRTLDGLIRKLFCIN